MGAIHFANAEAFRNSVDLHVSSRETSRLRSYLTKKDASGSIQSLALNDPHVECLVLDFSGVSIIDLTGVKSLETLYKDFDKREVLLLIASCPENVLHYLKQCKFFSVFPIEQLSPSILDSVLKFKLFKSRFIDVPD